jgi:serine/threonine-protein kinase
MVRARAASRVEFALALVGPPGSGKSETLRCLLSRLRRGARGGIASFPDRSGQTVLYDFLLLDVGPVASTEVLAELYALPGRDRYWLVERMILQHVDGVLLVADGADGGDGRNVAAYRRLGRALTPRGGDADFPVALFVNKRDIARGTAALPIEQEAVAHKIPVIRGSATTGEGLLDALKVITALTLRDLAARGGRRPAPTASPLDPGSHEAADVQHAAELYLRTFSAVTTVYSPHSDRYLVEICRRLKVCDDAALQEAQSVKRASEQARLPLELHEILQKRGMADASALRQALALQALGEVIHEEICYGKIAIESGFTDFGRVKHAIATQRGMDFGVGLGPLLLDRGHLSPRQHREILHALASLHERELTQEVETPDRPTDGTTQFLKAFGGRTRKTGALFGDLAIRYGFASQEQLNAALEEQRQLRRDGVDKYLGVILQEQGVLSDRQVEILCQSLQGELVKNPIENYKIEAELGRGAMGLVYAARQLNLDRIVALKVLDPRLAMDPSFIQNFQQEARAVAALNHPNIVQAYDVGRSRGYFYFAMEYVEGLTVKQLMEQRGALPVDEVLDIGVQVLRALAHATEHGLVHRDVKPANIMMTPDGVAKLCDLGLAREAGEGPDDKKIVGSPFYIAPEQIDSRSDVDGRADQYALACTLYHMLVGKPPYPGNSADEIFMKHITARIPDPSDAQPTIPRSVGVVLRKMMAKDREERFADTKLALEAMKTLRRELQAEAEGGIGRSITKRIKTMILRREE